MFKCLHTYTQPQSGTVSYKTDLRYIVKILLSYPDMASSFILPAFSNGLTNESEL